MYKSLRRPVEPGAHIVSFHRSHSSTVAVLGVVALTFVGCGEGDFADPESRLTEHLVRQLGAERLRQQRDDARHHAELAGAEADYQGAILAWAGTAAAMVILTLLLARERRARRVLERLLRLVLDRLRESRGPPSS